MPSPASRFEHTVHVAGMEYLVTMITDIPGSVDPGTLDSKRARETARVADLAAADHLLRLWKPPMPAGAPAEEIRTVGLFRATGTQN